MHLFLKLFILIFVTMFFLGCRKEIDVTLLNGYWEIDKVVFDNHSQKEFTINTWIDYIEIENNRGTRRKVQPNMDGTYNVSPLVEQINITTENDSVRLYYTTEFDRWEETLLEVTENRMILINRDKKTYYYQKFKPLSLD